MQWYDVPIAGAPIATGPTYLTPGLTASAVYYTLCYDALCRSERVPVNVIVKDFQYTLFIPNVFTPNGDGKNNYFEIAETYDWGVYYNKLSIFNRWGEKIYETEGSQLKWDGTSNGGKLTDGVHFYLFEGVGFTKSGSVTLVR